MSVTRGRIAVTAIGAWLLLTPSVRSEPATSSDEASSGKRDACAGAFEQSQILRRQGRLQSTRAHLAVCQESCPASVKARCDEWARELESAMPSFRPEAHDRAGKPLSNVWLRLDGRVLARELQGQAFEADPGTHRITFVAHDGSEKQMSIALREGQKQVPIVATFSHLQAPPPAQRQPSEDRAPPTGALVLGGVGAVALLAAGTLTLIGHLERAELEDCKDVGCEDEDVDAVASKWYAAGVLAGVGVLALSGAGVWWAVSGEPSAERDRSAARPVRLGVRVFARGAGLGIGGAF